MLADLSHRQARRERTRPVAPVAGGRRIVAAFKHRLHAERAVGALLDRGLVAEQIRLEGPADALASPASALESPASALASPAWADARPGWSGLGEGAACAALLGAAAWRAVPTAG